MPLLNRVRFWGRALVTIPRVSDEEWRRLDPLAKWLVATRAAVFLMTFFSALMGILMAARTHPVSAAEAALLVLGLVLAHATNNLLNDLTDWWKGIDRAGYVRNEYGVQPLSRGLINVRQMAWLIAMTGTPALCIGIYLAATNGWLVWQLLAAGAFFVLFYTWPLKPLGLGEPAVLLVWGPLMVGGSWAVLTDGWSWSVALASVLYALGPTCVLFGKHIDKLQADRERSVRTLPVLLGEERARRWVILMLGIQYLLPLLLIRLEMISVWVLAVWLALPHAKKTIDVYARPAPVTRPEHFPASLWPLWFSAWSFDHMRRYSLLLFLAMLLGVITGV